MEADYGRHERKAPYISRSCFDPTVVELLIVFHNNISVIKSRKLGVDLLISERKNASFGAKSSYQKNTAILEMSFLISYHSLVCQQ